jgi:PAS domain S-box-containing protein
MAEYTNLDEPGWRHLAALADDPLVYKHVFDNAIVGICVMTRRRFIRVNQRMAELFGYATDELEGRSVRLLYPSDEDYAEIGRRIVQVPRANAFSHEHPLVARDGSIRWCHISGRWFDPHDVDSPSVWIVHDASAMKEAEQQLARANARLEQRIAQRTRNLQKTNETLRVEVMRRRDSERGMLESREKYRVLLRNIPLGIAVTDATGDVVEINPLLQSWLDARNLEEFSRIAATTQFHLVEEDQPITLDELIRSRLPTETRRPDHVAVRWTGPSGQTRWFDVTGVRVPASGLGAAVVFADQTPQRQARDRELAQQHQLAHATRLSLMGQFASALAHELGQPLNAALSYAAGVSHQLADILPGYPEATDALAQLQLHLRQAGDVIHNVRAFVKRDRARPSPVDLLDLVHKTLALLQLQLRESATRVTVRVDPDLPNVCGNRVELQQVLVNLLVNALEALRAAAVPAPELRLRLSRPRRGQVQIEVADNGPGIPAALRETVFEPYRTSKRDGLGLGLTLCRDIVEAHGGRITLAAPRRRGAIFRILLEENGHFPADASPDLSR